MSRSVSCRGASRPVALIALATCVIASSAGSGCGTRAPQVSGWATDAGQTASVTDPATPGGPAGPSLPSTPSVTPSNACAAVSERATTTTVNLYILFEKANSLVGAKWQAAGAGLTAFLNDGQSAGLRAALNFFPRALDSTPECDQNAYKAPRVGFGELPANAGPIVAAIAAESPNGFSTPIYPALGGGLLRVYEEVQARKGEIGAVLLVTDGEPQGPGTNCGGVDPNLVASSETLAATGLSQLGIKTFVVGLPGVNPTAMDRIARAGGSDHALLVATTSMQSDFEAALATVRGHALPCEFKLPSKVASHEYATNKVNVTLTTSNSAAATLANEPACIGDGWHYDNADAPTKIELCPSTCALVQADGRAKIDILLGCDTIVK